MNDKCRVRMNGRRAPIRAGGEDAPSLDGRGRDESRPYGAGWRLREGRRSGGPGHVGALDLDVLSRRDGW
jgi:hypothetical protein